MKRKRSDKRHPMQPIDLNDDGEARFRRNAIVRSLLDFGKSRGFGLPEIAEQSAFSREDWNQFAQLIGYSVEVVRDLLSKRARRKR